MDKKIWQSKTVWASILTPIVTAFAPGVSHWVGANPQLFSSLLGGVFLLLRMISSGRISIADDKEIVPTPAPVTN